MVKIQEYVLAVRYVRQGIEYFDVCHNINETEQDAIKTVKEEWHKRNDHLFPESKSAEFFIKIDGRITYGRMK